MSLADEIPISAKRLAEHVKQIRKWLSDCENHHTMQCNQPGSSELPKRLIEFDKNTNLYHLIETESAESGKSYNYIALSYCWGIHGNMKTTLDVLPEMKREIPHSKLPQTVKDVFSLVRELGYRYLWIDALCIIQEDGGVEWEAEASKMGHVYANADLVIGATASAGVQDGLFTQEKDLSPEENKEFHRIMRTCRTMTQKEWYGCIKSSYPLLCRGWAFQERLLSRRIVHFTVFELVWECVGDRRCKCGSGGEERLDGKINNLTSALKECRLQPTAERTRLMWHECVMSFSKRDLTFLNDRLSAIDGIASFVRGPDNKAYEYLYFQGIWKDFLPWDLLWYCDETSVLEDKKPRRPSYSWSSVNSGVEWPACPGTCELKERFSLAISTGTCFESGLQNAPITDAKCFTATATIINDQPSPQLASTSVTELTTASSTTDTDQQLLKQGAYQPQLNQGAYKLSILSSLTPVKIDKYVCENNSQNTYWLVLRRLRLEVFFSWLLSVLSYLLCFPLAGQQAVRSLHPTDKYARRSRTSWIVRNARLENAYGLPFWPDIQLEMNDPDTRELYYVQIASVSSSAGLRQVGLVVERIRCAEQPRLFERVGVAGNMPCDIDSINHGISLSHELQEILIV